MGGKKPPAKPEKWVPGGLNQDDAMALGAGLNQDDAMALGAGGRV